MVKLVHLCCWDCSWLALVPVAWECQQCVGKRVIICTASLTFLPAGRNFPCEKGRNAHGVLILNGDQVLEAVRVSWYLSQVLLQGEEGVDICQEEFDCF